MALADLEALLAVFADPNVTDAFGVAPFDRPQMEQWVQRNLDHQTRYGYGLFVVVHRMDQLLIGDCGLEHLAVDAPEAELGYDLRSDYWGRGLATEAATAVRDYAFRELGLPRLISLIRQGNERSRRVAEKVGMRKLEDVNRYGRAYWLYGLSRNSADSQPLAGAQ
jgi:ribosomal-protein-alanine N-acetyltransferase